MALRPDIERAIEASDNDTEVRAKIQAVPVSGSDSELPRQYGVPDSTLRG